MTEKSVFRYKIDPSHVDFTQRASISSMCDIILEAAGEDAYKRGFGVDVLAERNLGWVLSRMYVELDYMPAEYCEFTLHTWISDYNRLASTRNFTLTDDEGRVFGRVMSQWCMLDFGSRMPADLSTIARMHDGAVVDAPSPCERPRRIAAVQSEPIACHKVVYSDIDFNRHMNTMRYIDIVCDMLPIEELERLNAVRLNMNFMRESRYGDDLSLCVERRGEARVFEYRNADGEALCRMSLELR